MKFRADLSRHSLLASLLASCFIVAFANETSGLEQKEKEKVVRREGSTVEINEYHPIPEATETCTPDECEWWKRVRQAGNDLYKKSDEKSKKRFYLLLYEGQQKAYRVPLSDRPPQMLVFGKLPQPDPKRLIKGTVVLSVEFRADASIGEVKIVKGLGSLIDDDVIRAARNNVFLPAIENHAFVTTRGDLTTRFSDKWNK